MGFWARRVNDKGFGSFDSSSITWEFGSRLVDHSNVRFEAHDGFGWQMLLLDLVQLAELLVMRIYLKS